MPGQSPHEVPSTDPLTVGSLISALTHPDQQIRATSAGSLVTLGGAVAEPLIATVHNISSPLRAAASAVLCQIGEPALAPLMQARAARAEPVALDRAWWARVVSAPNDSDPLDILLFALLSRLLIAQPEPLPRHTAALRQYFSPATGDAILDFVDLLSGENVDALAEGLYGLLGAHTASWMNQQPDSLVLSIDGDPNLRGAIKAVMEVFRPNIGLVFAPCGAVGLVLAQLLQPDLIVTAVKYEGPDGFETMSRLLGSPKVAHIPFAFLTILADQESIERGKALGALAYEFKPFEARQLFELLDQAFAQIRGD